MKASTRQLRAVPATPEVHEDRAEVAHIRDGDETRQIYRARSEDDDLDESEDDEATEEEEDEVVQAAEANRN